MCFFLTPYHVLNHRNVSMARRKAMYVFKRRFLIVPDVSFVTREGIQCCVGLLSAIKYD